MYSSTPAFYWGFEKELKVAKRLFEQFPSFSRELGTFLLDHIGSTPNGSGVQPYAGAPLVSTCSQDSVCGAHHTQLAASVIQSLLELVEAFGSLVCPWGSPHYYPRPALERLMMILAWKRF